jgi:hypothetical protein
MRRNWLRSLWTMGRRNEVYGKRRLSQAFAKTSSAWRFCHDIAPLLVIAGARSWSLYNGTVIVNFREGLLHIAAHEVDLARGTRQPTCYDSVAEVQLAQRPVQWGNCRAPSGGCRLARGKPFPNS